MTDNRGMYCCLFRYAHLGWVQSEYEFSDFESALFFAEVERELTAPSLDFEPERLPILEYQIIEAPQQAVLH